ncbi:RelA/SpoT family protein [Eilatimonas milleporae]|uniref:GTP pyrophosphokinase rsh n=1 Tax=Eilatimonas milleporae TaxID=911205 RepID=A0A3M0C3J9_9PROT|nr:bifunctional (p)ppGpp synthetase/guanosine-3',5'-bis(diphosphate) 3'-pyrophosphohydrolase [Eilatimonas milleporae]RMB04431.1 GTP pyrophosphokinase [Eilatimonas milleporae]
MIRQYELVEKVKSYDPEVDEALLNRAYVFAMRAHGTQRRASGDPYFSHPLEVAGILTNMKLDGDTIATALLHDVVEDTVAEIGEIDELFGSKVAELVDGVTKLSKIELQAESDRQAENFRKFLLAMSNDIRVLLVKLADRLHNMRTLSYIKKEEKRRRIALETLEIYAPLAERIGMHEMKDELENLSFQHLDPEAMQTITARLHYLIEQNPYLEKEMVEVLKSLLAEHGIEVRLSSRIKRPYSIWRKMERQNIAFEQLSDVMAFRIIVQDVETCYRALGIVHQAFPMVPGRFKDYLSTPKRNYYRSLHTTVIGPHNRRLEIQIRTQRMHEEAEYGVAAHWQYKQGADPKEGSQYRWVRDLLEILEHASDSEEFLEHTKLDMFTDKVFCFTPKGELISLPRGSSPVDFAYAVHTEVGDHCVGAKVNGRMVPLRYQLENGDQVQILTSREQMPSPRWESFVITGKARSAIRRYVRHQRESEYIQLGQSLLDKACRRNGLDYNEEALREAAGILNLHGRDDLLARVGQGVLTEEAVLRAAYPGFEKDARSNRLPTVHKSGAMDEDHVIPVYGASRDSVIRLAECCHPVRGDRIVGIRVPGEGVTIHAISCSRLDEYDDQLDVWVDLAWQGGRGDDAYYVGRLRLEVVNEMGALASIAGTVSKGGANISNLQIPERDPEFYIMLVDVEVRDVKHLSDISRTLRASRVVSSVDRILG